MMPLVISKDAAEELASLLEQAANQHASKHLAAYHLRLISVMMRECPDDHVVVVDPAYAHSNVET